LIGSKVSKRYAKALFSLGQEDGSYEQYGLDLEAFTTFFKENMEFRQVIANPIFPLEERKKLLHFVLGQSQFSDTVKNFLNLLLDKERMRGIEAIAEHYKRLSDEVSGIARAEIITARPLKTEAMERLEKSLEALVSKKIKSEISEDKSLIGGVVVKIGDLILDGSIRAQLEGLKESL
jgi:F-type H+-transporting ATPase subunit delta